MHGGRIGTFAKLAPHEKCQFCTVCLRRGIIERSKSLERFVPLILPERCLDPGVDRDEVEMDGVARLMAKTADAPTLRMQEGFDGLLEPRRRLYRPSQPATSHHNDPRLLNAFVRQSDVVLGNGGTSCQRTHEIIQLGLFDALAERVDVRECVQH